MPSESIYESLRLAAGYAYDRPPVHRCIIQRAGEYLGITGGRQRALDVGCGAGLSTAAQVQGVVAVCEDFLRRQVAGLCRPGDIRYDATSRTTCRKGASWR